MKAKAFAPTNIALAKYWGKRDIDLNLPANGSLSATLDHFGSTTSVEFNSSLTEDIFFLNGKADRSTGKVRRVLDRLRKLSGHSKFAHVESSNNFPTGAGLASSASGLAALTVAGSQALGLDLSKTKLSEIARQGSGSASRSLDEGFVEWKRGELSDGSDSVASSVFSSTHFPLNVFIAVISAETKHTLSTDGMLHTQRTSPYFDSWVASAEESISKIKEAIAQKNFELLAALTEANCLQMHASAMAAVPAVIYFKPQTLQVIEKVRALRADGCEVFFTIDAGPNVVVFSSPENSLRVEDELRALKPADLLKTKLGKGACLL